LLRLIGEVGRFDIGGDVITFGAKARELPPRVFLTVIQADGTFKAIEKL
jgi:branched-chain amino acid transport system substrate-binding protein